jgi:hypothetical protein
VIRRRDGRFQRYRLAPTGLAALRAELDAFWTAELDSLVYDALSHPVISALERQP